MTGKRRSCPDGGQFGRAARVGPARKAVRLAVFLLVVAGLFAGIGWGSYSSMGIDSVAYLCPLGALETLLASKTAVPRFIAALLVALVLAVLLGRAFCAWICPVPPIERFFHPRGGKPSGEGKQVDADSPDTAAAPPLTAEERELLTVARCGADAARCGADTGSKTARQPAECGASPACSSCLTPVGGSRDGFKLDSRHGVLLGALASAAVFGFPVFCLVCPIGLAIATVVAVWQAFVGHAPSWSLLVFPLILIVELVVFRKWCHALCPMGALMSLLGQKSLFRPKVDSGRCLRGQGIDCRACVSACPEQLDPHSAGLSECTKCGACVDACPAHAIAMPAISSKTIEKRLVPRKGC